MADPLVSIICITYNHEPYIRQCLDGFMMQKTNFPFEVLIHDDASTDKTADIIREYKARYPDVIKPIYQTENQYSKGVKIGLTYLYPNAKGKYIAECEGDDYWTDPLKLQKQVDFLEDNPSYSLCVHHYQILENNKLMAIFPKFDGDLSFSFETYISNTWYTQTLTSVFRKEALNFTALNRYDRLYDCVLFYNILQSGDAFLMSDNMGIYRKHHGGVWALSSSSTQAILNFSALVEIYSVEDTEAAAQYLYNCVFSYGYLGISFFKNGMKLYFKIMLIVYKRLGFLKAMKLFFHSINYAS